MVFSAANKQVSEVVIPLLTICFVLQGLFTKSKKEKQKLYCAFIDFKKAFNSVYRDGLWYKLYNLGCKGRLLKVLMNMYSKIRCCVNTEYGFTDFFLTKMGVQQGAVPSPILFCMYINDLKEWLAGEGDISVNGTDVNLLMYADDIVVFTNSREVLQNCLDKMYDYCQRWKLSVNLKKTKILIGNHRGPMSQHDFWFWGG